MAFISKETIEAVNQASILDLANAFGDHPRRVGKQHQVYCPNPGHDEKTPDTYIEPNKNIFTCFGGGGCGAKGSNVFSYYYWHEYGRAYDKNNKEDRKNFPIVIEKIAQLLGIPIKYEDGQTVNPSGGTYSPRRKQVKELEPQSDEICDKVYRAFLSMCPIRKEHAVEWLKERQYSQEEVVTLGFRSVPTGEELMKILYQLVTKNYPLERVPGFVQRLVPENLAVQYPRELVEEDPQGRGFWVWTITAAKGYFIPVRDRKGRFIRLRVRRDEGKPKYLWFSSYDNTAIEKEKYQLRKNGVSSGSPLHIAPPVSQVRIWEIGTELSDIYNVQVVIGSEGEHKAQISANKLGATVIGIPGVGNFREVLPLLSEWGTQKFILAYDMDSLKREDDSVKSQKKQQNLFDKLTEFAKEVMKLGIDCYLWTWDIKDGKGLDDLLQGSKKLPMEINLRTGQRKLVDLKELYHIA
ncbi:CHC2 zinc finger domain-containing protein [Bacillus sp. FJAT-29937]|uniref:CHC2 zinc finger domain-containing protein n=1 Tax=Bacillus sp. FJAT-29937 TaxID=1720553 RepID=UPI0008317B4F|nr:CHC2 zinc finger domain-containing protein [Bacillus sp. FJAT-29937]